MSKEKRRLVVDNKESSSIAGARRLFEKEANGLQLKLDKKYFKNSKK